MAGDDVVLNYVANDAGMIAFQRKMRNELDREREQRQKLQKQMQEQATTTRNVAREQAAASRRRAADEERVAKIARKAVESLRTPYQQYEKQVHDLQEALDGGKLSTDQFRRAKMQLLRQMREEKRAQDGTNDEMREAAAVVDKTRTATERYEMAVKRLNKLREKGRIDATTHKRAVEQERESMQKATPQAESFGKRMGEVAAGVLSANAAMALGRKAVELLREEYDRLIERQQKSLGATTTLAAAQVAAVKNLGQDELSAPQLLKRIRSASRRIGVDETELTRAASDALSARGDNTAATAVDSVIAAAEVSPFDAETRRALSGAALDLSKNNKRGLRGSLGFLQSLATVSRVTKDRNLAENATPAIAGVQQFGGSEEFAGALFGAISSGAVDVTGRQTGTAMIQLAKQISEFAPGQNLEGGFRTLQTLPGAREDFFGKVTDGGFGASFDATVLPVVKALLTPGTAVNQQFQGALGKLSGVSGIDVFNQNAAAISSIPSVQTSRLQQGLQNAVNQVALSDQSGARSAAIREGLTELRAAIGQGGTYAGLSSLLDDAQAGGVLDEGTLRAGLGELQGSLRRASTGFNRRDFVMDPDKPFAARAALNFRRLFGLTGDADVGREAAGQQLDAVNNLIEILDRQAVIQEEMRDAILEQNADRKNAGNQQVVIGRNRNRGESGP